MGRIKTKWMKTVAKRLVEKYPNDFSNKFEANKEKIKELNLIDSKKMRNKVAGAVIKAVKKQIK